MKRTILSGFRLILCGIEALAFCIFVPIPNTDGIAFARFVQAADCVENLTVQVTANPASILNGQSSIVSWSIGMAPECGYALVQLNGQPVASSGSQTVTLTRSTTYQVTVFLNLDGVPMERTAYTRVTVSDESTDRFCPNLPLLTNVEVWEPEPRVDQKQFDFLNPGLTERLHIPSGTIHPGPSVLLNFDRPNDDEIPLPFGPSVTLLSTCALWPGAPDPSLEEIIPRDASDPAARLRQQESPIFSVG